MVAIIHRNGDKRTGDRSEDLTCAVTTETHHLINVEAAYANVENGFLRQTKPCDKSIKGANKGIP